MPGIPHIATSTFVAPNACIAATTVVACRQSATPLGIVTLTFNCFVPVGSENRLAHGLIV